MIPAATPMNPPVNPAANPAKYNLKNLLAGVKYLSLGWNLHYSFNNSFFLKMKNVDNTTSTFSTNIITKNHKFHEPHSLTVRGNMTELGDALISIKTSVIA